MIIQYTIHQLPDNTERTVADLQRVIEAKDNMITRLDGLITSLNEQLRGADERIAELEGDRNNLLIALQQIYEGDYEIGEHIELACRALDCS